MNRALNDYIGIEAVNKDLSISGDFKFAGSEQESMIIQIGKVKYVPEKYEEVIKIDETVYYNKARKFSFKTLEGESVIMIPIGSIVLVGSLD